MARTNQPVTLAPPAVGGVSEAPDATALPDATRSPARRGPWWLMGVFALAMVAMGIRWKLRRP